MTTPPPTSLTDSKCIKVAEKLDKIGQSAVNINNCKATLLNEAVQLNWKETVTSDNHKVKHLVKTVQDVTTPVYMTAFGVISSVYLIDEHVGKNNRAEWEVKLTLSKSTVLFFFPYYISNFSSLVVSSPKASCNSPTRSGCRLC